MIGIVIWVVFAACTAFVFGEPRTIGFWKSFLFCLALTPFVGAFISLCTKSKKDDRREKEMLQLQRQTAAATQAAVRTPLTPQQSLTAELKELAEMHQKHQLTDQQYQDAKNKLIARID